MAFDTLEIGIFFEAESRQEQTFGSRNIRRSATLDELDGDYETLLEKAMEDLL